MANQTPTIDWPRRTNPLNGNEDLLRQNPLGDASSLPKEERITAALIKDYVLTFVPNTATIVSGRVSGNNLILTLSDKSTIIIDVTPTLVDIKLVSGVYNAFSQTLDLTLSDNSLVQVSLASLIALSTDAGQIATIGTDGGILVTDTSNFIPTWLTQEFTSNGTSNSLVLSVVPQDKLQTFVYIGGQKIPTSKYTLVGSTITFTGFTLNNGDVIEVNYVNY